MTTTPDPTAGTVLGEEARRTLYDVLASARSTVDAEPIVPVDQDKLRDLFRKVEPVIAALLSAAREAGREEGRAEEWRRGAPARYAAYEALVHAERRCRYHDPIGAKLGFERGLPRCESCQQPYRVNAALDAIDLYTRADA